MKKILLFTFLLIQFATFSQNKIATIIDAISGESIPYANIKIGTNSNNVSNGDGKFNLPASLENEVTKIEISYIGYETQQLSFAQLEKQNFIIKLVPGIYELSNVNVSDKKEDVAAIMAKVKANLKENYTPPTTPFQARFFFVKKLLLRQNSSIWKLRNQREFRKAN